MTTNETGAPTDTGMPVTETPVPTDAGATEGRHDPLAQIDADALRVFAAIADLLIPAAHGMPSAGEIVGADRARFVLRARPDLVEPLRAALRPGLGEDHRARLAALEGQEPTNLAALQLVIVGGYYTDKRVRELIGYPGQEAIQVKSWVVPPYLEEGLIDAMLARGPVWRDPATGRRAIATGTPSTYAERWTDAAGPREGGHDGRDST